MKAEELRLGNYVDLFGKVAYITKSDFSETDYGIAIESGKPIPLTEEWLLRFGFYKSKNDWGNTFHIMNKDGITADYTIQHWTNASEKSKFKNYWLFDRLGKARKNYYVHQLQNLYFALTGEELTLNIDK